VEDDHYQVGMVEKSIVEKILQRPGTKMLILRGG
jgi:hypothetical protein